nr:immunoglobulin light chain junction region [Macaca mulatta]
CQQGHNYPWTF